MERLKAASSRIAIENGDVQGKENGKAPAREEVQVNGSTSEMKDGAVKEKERELAKAALSVAELGT